MHTILDCPAGTFQGAGVKTVVLFFKKGEPTKDIWYYQLDPKRSLGKTNPLNDADLSEFVHLAKSRSASAQSWKVDVKDIDPANWDLSVKNPNVVTQTNFGNPEELLSELEELSKKTDATLAALRSLL